MAKIGKKEPFITPSGEEITEEEAEKIADEVESEDEVVWVRRIILGRPSLDGKGISPKVSFRIPTELYEEVQVRANKERRTVSDITREALEKFLKG
jgi:Ribbon-helix-helix protein, copG family